MKEEHLDSTAIGQRIKALRSESLGLSQEAFARLLGVTRGAVGNWELGKGIKFENIQKMAVILNQPVEWIATGRGQLPGNSSNAEPSESNPSKPRLVSSFDPDEDVYSGNGYSREHWKPRTAGAIPELDVKLGAGNGTIGEVINLPVGDNSVSGHKVIREWLIPVDYLQDEIKASPRHSTIMEVIGDSMQPTYLPGDRVIVDLSQDTMSADTVYAISYDDEPPQIKRLQKVPFSDPKQVKIISDNPILETFSVELDKLTIIGRICGHIARK
ncbi:LexA family transcriptional regulator [Ochrobactrum sp. SFR4]|uniref:LexA family transcriptional regulator n=1 Tax=Ochrobactrum sp. SFR4 TaxID=2717368 RepID=UPI001C8B3625|nr:LexA family transcriptional regulator [Ochrobactrum sp. SFR4]MBX8825272.1 LexA family transcriptional regulator [Ochrobactrum sp. SFR4]